MIIEQKILAISKNFVKEGLLKKALEHIESNLKTVDFSIEIKIELLLLLCQINNWLGRYEENKIIANSIISLSKDDDGLIFYYYRAKILLAHEKYCARLYKDCSKNIKSIEKAIMNETKLNAAQKAEMQIRIVIIKGSLAQKSGEYELCFKLYSEALEFVEVVENDHLIGSLYNHFGISHTGTGNLEEALKYYKITLSYWRKSGGVIALSSIINNLGVNHAMRGELDEGAKFFQEALTLNEKTGNKRNIATQLSNLGIIFFNKGELDTSYEYYQRALVSYKEIDSKMQIGETYSHIGNYFQRKGELDTALEYLNDSKKIFEEYNNAQYLGLVNLSIGEVYYSKMDFGKAKRFTEKSIEYSEKINHDIHVSQGIYQLIKILLETNSIKQAKEHLTKLHDISEKKENKQVTMLYRLAKAFILQSEENTSDELSFASLHSTLGRFVTAKDLINEIINGEVIDYERIVEGIFNLCELLIMELKILGNESILDELDLLTNKLVEIGEKQNAFSLLAKTFLLKGKLELLKPDLDAARKLFEKAQQISKDKGYKLLAKVIKQEHRNLDSSYDKLLNGKESTLADRLGALKLEGFLFSLKQNRVETYSANAATSAPSMKDLAGFAQSLQKRKVGW